eukprot:g27693.t1
MPARTFRTVATTIKSHCCLGLTATLVREDDLIQDLHWLIGPKLYEANWQQLQELPEFFMEYLQAQDGGDVPGSMRGSLQRALWTCNPNKLKTCEFLIRLHEQRGDKIIVFSDNIFILKEFARKLGRYYICGSSSACNTIFLSKVGDNAIDLPVANVIVQISSHYGSRRQEAQRLGRILRPKPQAKDGGTGGFNAFFYSVVSRDTQELYHANRRQQFLVEQGYNYQVVRDYNVTRLEQQNLIYSSKDSQLQLLKQVLESVRRGEAEEADEVLEPGCETPRMETAPSKAEKVEKGAPSPTPGREQVNVIAGPSGAKVAVLLETGLEAALGDGQAEPERILWPVSVPVTKKERFAQKMLAVKKVPIFRHLNKQQTERVVMSLQDRKCQHGEVVIRQGESGQHFFVIVKGETTVTIDGKKIRTQGKNASFGDSRRTGVPPQKIHTDSVFASTEQPHDEASEERALLFDEPRSATVQVSSEAAELWTLEKSVFKQIITEKMRRDLEYRISIQDAGVTLSDLKPLSFLGAGAFSTVRLVEHRKTGAKYALKTCKRTLNGKMPTEMKTECDILAENDHPFILYMVAVFETKTYVSMLTEILAGGELWSALRKLPVMLPREAVQSPG